MNEREIVEKAIRDYAMHYAIAAGKSDPKKLVPGVGESPLPYVEMFSAYANLLATKSIERLTLVLAFSTLALALVTAISLLLR